MGVTHVNGPLEIHVTSNNTYVIIYCIDAKLINNLEEQIFNQFNPDLNEIDDKCKPSKEDIKKIPGISVKLFLFWRRRYEISRQSTSEKLVFA